MHAVWLDLKIRIDFSWQILLLNDLRESPPKA
jgi:hypothetical protein